MQILTPREIVSELDKYIVGQKNAKRAVAIALRNRWRRQQVPDDLREEIAPKNIIMIGPTGVGKTEIARRLAKLAQAPFIKVEASKFTEVGYVGRDVESIIRDLTELSVKMVKEEEKQKVQRKAEEIAEDKLLDLLLPVGSGIQQVSSERPAAEIAAVPEQGQLSSREKLRALFRAGRLNERIVELEVSERHMPMIEIFSTAGIEEMGLNMKEMFGNLFPKKSKKRRVKVPEAYQLIIQEEASKLIDTERVQQMAVQRVEQSGIVFLDEIDKIAGKGYSHGPDVSREGVQRDLLPIVEGSTVNTKYGMVKTDHILFIAAGAFHSAKPSDLLPELQGRFPIRVELESLGRDDFIRILKEPKNALIKQYVALLKTENIKLEFGEDAIDTIAEMAMKVNETAENIGARRLHTIMEKLIEEISFNATDMVEKKVGINAGYVREKLSDLVKNEDLSKYIL